MEITRNGDLIVINLNGTISTEHVDNFVISRQGEDFLSLGYNHKVKRFDDITNIQSTSLEDLHNKLNTLLQ